MGIVKSILSKGVIFLIRKLNSLDNIVSKNEIINNPNFYEDLTPVDNADEDKKYSDAISWALKNDKIKNIAITGPYGSGKSSVLRTFEKEHDEYIYLNISLSSFKDDLEKTQTDENKNALIEKSILQQIFYRVKSKTTPYSRFNRIENNNSFSNMAKSVSLAFWIIAALYAYNPDNEAFRGLIGDDLFANKPYLFEIIIFVLFGFVIVLKESLTILSHSKLTKISFGNSEIGFNENLGASILNKHLDEILYFFEKTNFNVVVIEDLDRFDEVDIFIKLRELNTLINNSDQIDRKIVFIYAIKDDVFKEANRTKFFDFIVPIIPVINASNSGDILYRKFSYSASNNSISRSFINNVTLYIEDMRMLKNIYNEFVIYKNKLSAVSGIELPLDKLLGFIVYKNKYPDDFAKLNSDQGMVAGIFNRKRDLVNKLVLSVEAQIIEMQKKIAQITSENMGSIHDLRRMYISALFENVPSLSGVVNPSNNQRHTFSELLQENVFSLLRMPSQIMGYSLNQGNFYIGITFDKLEELVNPTMSYDQKVVLIEQKTNGYIDELKNEIDVQIEYKRDIKYSSIKNLIAMHSAENIFEGDVKEQKLLIYLIRNGFIDEMYQTFISYFYEGNITKSDMAFVLSVKNHEPLEFTHALVKVKEVIEKLDPNDFKTDAILNFDLLNALINDPKNSQYLGLIMSKINNGSKKSLEFIDVYITSQPHLGVLINKLCNAWTGFWRCIVLDSEYSLEKINNYLEMIIRYADIKDLIKLNVEGLLTKYISEKQDFLDFTSDINDIPKLKEVITKLQIKFVYISNPESNKELFDFINKKNFYEINERMIELILSNYNPDLLKDALLSKSNYTTILDSHCENLIEYVDANINEYVNNVFLKLEENIDESEASVISLLNNEKVEEVNKTAIIKKEIVLLNNISDIDDHNLWKEVVLSSKIRAIWDNVIQYFVNSDSLLDEALISFLNRKINYEVLSKTRLKLSESVPEEIKLSRSISGKIILCDDLSDESYEHLLISIPFIYSSIPGIENVSNSKVGILIRHGKLKLTKEIFNLLKENFNTQYALLVEKNISTFIRSIDEYELDPVGLQMLLKSKIISADQKIIIVNAIDASMVDNELELTSLIYDTLLGRIAGQELSLPILGMLLKQKMIPMLEKVKLFNSQVKHLDISVITSLLELFGPPISGITINQQPTVDNNDTYKLFANMLKDKGLISSFKEKDNMLRLYPKKS